MVFKDYYKILGVAKNATLENIKIAYRKLSKKFHPDLNNGDKFFEEKFKEIQEAYEILSDISKRKHYDYINDTTINNREYDENLRKKEDEFRKQEEDFLKREEIIRQKEEKISETENLIKNKESSSTYKVLIFFLILILFAVLSTAYNLNQKNNTTNTRIIEETTNDNINNEVKSSISEPNVLNDKSINDKNIEAKSLITNNSVGFFKIGNPWKKIAKYEYEFQFIQGYGTCVDAACDGGFDLGKNLVIDEDGFVENPEITIGALLFKRSESFDDENERNKYINRKDVFYISSSNLSAWYWGDKISYLIILSDKFSTKEGIGVGVTLEKVDEILGNLEIEIGWLEEDRNAVQVKISSYPDIRFILDVDDAVGGYEKLGTLGQKAIISDFKKNTKIKRIIINSKSN
ncbi:J domain-containing protein [Flavobacterium sp. CAN_S2]|uniref:J domain-containing protein n=1 Tax=Flavobacterium sp. CAN_S2 TaxID=2787726 RepID=UPI0018CB5C8F